MYWTRECLMIPGVFKMTVRSKKAKISSSEFHDLSLKGILVMNPFCKDGSENANEEGEKSNAGGSEDKGSLVVNSSGVNEELPDLDFGF